MRAHLLDYVFTHLDSKIRRYASDVMLRMHREGSYESVSSSCSRSGGIFLSLDDHLEPAKARINDPIHAVCVMS